MGVNTHSKGLKADHIREEYSLTPSADEPTLPLTIFACGKAGEGVKKAAQVITQTCLRRGRYVFQADDYQSLIRGGHNFSVVTTDTQPVYSTYDRADLIICFDHRSYEIHQHSLKPNGILVYNSDETTTGLGIGIPFNTYIKEIYDTKSNPSVGAIAIFAALSGFSSAELLSIVAQAYPSNPESNALFAEKVYMHTLQLASLRLDPVKGDYFGRLYSGNQLIILGAYAAGMDFYYGYPMTPASSLLHYAASLSAKLGITAVHAESELAAINMAIGSAFAGCPAAVGSSGGGFALMQEAFSLSGMAEVPLLCILSSRPGPATGVSTYTAQEDLSFALHQGHGEFARVVASPDSLERAYTLAAELLAIAWKFQIPVILLTEKHLSESMTNVRIAPEAAETATPVNTAIEADYQRYRIVGQQTGVSPLLFPPSAQSIKWNSHEHMESGLRTDKATDMVAMKDKRHRKYPELKAHLSGVQTVAEYGEGEQLIFAYGSTALSIREAMKYLKYSVKLIVPIYLEPFPVAELSAYRNRTALVVEYSRESYFATLLQNKLRINTTYITTPDGGEHSTLITRYDGRTFDPLDLARKIDNILQDLYRYTDCLKSRNTDLQSVMCGDLQSPTQNSDAYPTPVSAGSASCSTCNTDLQSVMCGDLQSRTQNPGAHPKPVSAGSASCSTRNTDLQSVMCGDLQSPTQSPDRFPNPDDTNSPLTFKPDTEVPS